MFPTPLEPPPPVSNSPAPNEQARIIIPIFYFDLRPTRTQTIFPESVPKPLSRPTNIKKRRNAHYLYHPTNSDFALGNGTTISLCANRHLDSPLSRHIPPIDGHDAIPQKNPRTRKPNVFDQRFYTNTDVWRRRSWLIRCGIHHRPWATMLTLCATALGDPRPSVVSVIRDAFAQALRCNWHVTH